MLKQLDIQTVKSKPQLQAKTRKFLEENIGEILVMLRYVKVSYVGHTKCKLYRKLINLISSKLDASAL